MCTYIKSKTKNGKLLLVMLDEALALLLTYIHWVALSREAHQNHLEALQRQQTAWPHPPACV